MLKGNRLCPWILVWVFVFNFAAIFNEVKVNAAVTTVTVYTSEDSWVSNDAANRTVAHGDHTQLSVMSTSFGTNVQLPEGAQYRYAYLKFDLRDIKQKIVTAKLFYTYYTAARIPAFHAVDDSWSESTLVFDNKPTMGTTLTTKSYGSTSSAWADETAGIDLSGYIIAEQAGDGIASVGVDMPAVSTTSTADFRIGTTASPSTAAGRPRLELTVSENEYSSAEYYKGVQNITATGLTPGVVTSKVLVTNNKTGSMAAVLINAVYKAGQLCNVAYTPYTNISNSGTQIPLTSDITVPNDGSTYVIKTFLWSDMAGMIPFTSATQFGSGGIITN